MRIAHSWSRKQTVQKSIFKLPGQPVAAVFAVCGGVSITHYKTEITSKRLLSKLMRLSTHVFSVTVSWLEHQQLHLLLEIIVGFRTRNIELAESICDKDMVMRFWRRFGQPKMPFYPFQTQIKASLQYRTWATKEAEAIHRKWSYGPLDGMRFYTKSVFVLQRMGKSTL